MRNFEWKDTKSGLENQLANLKAAAMASIIRSMIIDRPGHSNADVIQIVGLHVTTNYRLRVLTVCHTANVDR